MHSVESKKPSSSKQRIHYLGNRKLRAADVEIPYTAEQALEIKKCKEDIFYFASKYMKITNVDGGFINFNPYPFQVDLLNLLDNERFVISKIARQSGKSTSYIVKCLHVLLFREHYGIGVFGNVLKTARQLFGLLKKAYEALPFWLQQGVVECTKTTLILENGSFMIANATTENAARGFSFNLLILDEFAMVPTNIAEEFYTSVIPTVTSGKTTQVFIVSTPKGMNNYFYKLWVEAEQGINGYKTFTCHYSNVPGRDQAWAEMMIKKLGQNKFDQEYGCEFHGSELSLIDAKILKNIPVKVPLYTRNEVDVYVEPQENHSYVITVDVSEGKAKDYHAFSVIDVTELPYVQVAKFRSNKLDPMVYPEYIAHAGTWYNEASVLVELNNNGSEIANTLWYELEYENVLRTQRDPKLGQKLSYMIGDTIQYGVKMSSKVKTFGAYSLKSMIENQKLIINDSDTLSELTSFVRVKNSWGGDKGGNDDLAMTLVTFGWLSSQKEFKEFTETDFRSQVKDEKFKEFLLPVRVNGKTSLPGEVAKEQADRSAVWYNPYSRNR